MANPALACDLDDFPLDSLAQHERINTLYTPITFCFPLRRDVESRRSEIIDTISNGISRLGTNFPWTAGRVTYGEDGVFQITPWPARPDRLQVRDLRDDPTAPTWDDLREKEFPFALLDEDVIAPCKTVVAPGAERPVLLVQANFVRGGLLLTVSAQHGSMDVAGQAQVIHLLARAMRGEVFSRDEIEAGNAQRMGHIPFLPPGECGTQACGSEEPGGDGAKQPKDPPKEACKTTPSLQWAYLAFPHGESLTALKALATRDLPPGFWVSCDDALTAFLWQAITCAREPRLLAATTTTTSTTTNSSTTITATTTTLIRNVDARAHFDLPPSYPGLVVTTTTHTSPIAALADGSRSLGSVAEELRRALLDGVAVRATAIAAATSMARGGGNSGGGSKGPRARMTTSAGGEVKVSSWAKERLYDVDFGPLLGRAEAVRRPRFREGAREGLVYLLPRARDGEVVAGVCLVEEDMARLRASPEVGRWARWIG